MFFGISLFIVGLFSYGFAKTFKNRKNKWVFLTFITVAFILVSGVLSLIFACAFLPYIFMVIGAVMASYIEEICVVRTDEYIKLLGEIEGFKNFIKLAEKDRLEMLLKDEPNLFYNVLPYAQVLKVSDIWEDKFKSIPIEAPSYVSVGSGQDIIDTIAYMHILNHLSISLNSGYTRYIASQVVKTAAIVASHGRSGGGGFHGGGGHGGGGGRGI